MGEDVNGQHRDGGVDDEMNGRGEDEGGRSFPDPSPQDVWSRTRTGMSAPRRPPRSARSVRERFKFQRRLSATSTAAASALPPPRPPPNGDVFV